MNLKKKDNAVNNNIINLAKWCINDADKYEITKGYLDTLTDGEPVNLRKYSDFREVVQIYKADVRLLRQQYVDPNTKAYSYR